MAAILNYIGMIEKMNKVAHQSAHLLLINFVTTRNLTSKKFCISATMQYILTVFCRPIRHC